MVILSRFLALLCSVALFYCHQAASQNHNILDVDFMQSMTDGNPKGEKLLTRDPKRSHYLQIFKENYEAKKPSKMPYSKEPLIPKVMHQIWDGDIPPLYQNYLDECKKLHPNWEFKLWGDKEVEELGLMYKDLYDKMRSYVVKADVLRYEILYRFGGVYRDMDVKCLKSTDDLNHMYDFYASLESFTHRFAAINIGNIGSKPNNPIFKNVLDAINKAMDDSLSSWDNDLEYVDAISPHLFAFPFTFNPFTDELIRHMTLSDKSIAFPTSYYLPILYNRDRMTRSKKFGLFDLDVKSHFSNFKPETLMWHNEFKGEIRAGDFLEANGRQLLEGQQKILKTMPVLEQKKFNTYHYFYQKNPPSTIGWNKTPSTMSGNKKSKIPQIIHFVVFSDNELAKLQEHLPNWRMLNANFDISIWSQSRIVETFPELKPFLQDQLGRDASLQDARLYVALKILEKFGGSYADFKAIPHMPIFELHNKYNFYAGLRPLTSGKTVTLSSRLIGSDQNNPIILRVLSRINPDNLGQNLSQDLSQNVSQIDEILALEVYKNIYLYGKNIVLPAMYFEPLDLDSYSFFDKIYRFLRFIPNTYFHPNEYSIIE